MEACPHYAKLWTVSIREEESAMHLRVKSHCVGCQEDKELNSLWSMDEMKALQERHGLDPVEELVSGVEREAEGILGQSLSEAMQAEVRMAISKAFEAL